MDPAVEGWRDILQPQLLDLTLFAAFSALALVSFFRKSVPLKYVTFVAAVGYMGFTKSSLVSVSDVFRLTDLSVPEFKYSLVWYAFMAFVVVTTVLWGRVYCGRVCAFGAMTQLLDPIIPRRMRFEIPVRVEKYANLIKYGVLALVAWSGGTVNRDALRPQSLLPVPVSGRRGARPRLAGDDRVSHQTLVRVQQLQDLREDLRVGRDPRAVDRQERVRALR